MKNALSFLLLFVLFGTACNREDISGQKIKKISAIRGYENYIEGTFRCGIFVPPSYNTSNKYPLVLSLHGYSDTTTWSLSFYNEPVVSEDPCIVLTPKCTIQEKEGWGDSWNPEASPMMKKAMEMVELARKSFNIDTTRIYVFGTSMGGFGTLSAIRKNPGLFTAAYVKCGGGDPQMAEMLVNFPLWMIHGSIDSIVPVKLSRDIYNGIIAKGGKVVKHTEFPGVGHNVWDYPRNEDTWIRYQKKGEIHGIPGPVLGLTAATDNLKHICLTWNTPDDQTNKDNNAWYYNIFRNDEKIDEVFSPLTTFTDTTVVKGTHYTYKISVMNFFFNESEVSVPVSIAVK
jgi:hypothetical protein